ncbi:HesA/MoeB/ThiF family protein [Arcobacter sp. FWKO B]|uniref:HesA/MoeB/ThiF family protein n=1 Tax=Arcobacter sp. FWKO B TaxID=2593672 RepID=UPI0018A5658A|nr:ThiF family adenylyltransferase [Arcobacter sp. FWKO B]QOG13071.1 thiamine biosynthesis protein ThiF [Arcobacter sp. FWKO B]
MQVISEEYTKFFHRQIELWGEETQVSLLDKKILIIGSGGLGCSLGIALGSSGIGQIDLVDFDEVSLHNIHRQVAFKTNDVGKKKCEVLKELILSRNPFVTVNSYDCDLDTFITNHYSQLTINYDLIIDATDNLPTRAKIDNFAKRINIPWLYGSVEEFHGHICLFNKASFESVFQVTNRKPAGIAAPIVVQIAATQANIALRFLAGQSVSTDKLYYCYYDKNGDFSLQKFGV